MRLAAPRARTALSILIVACAVALLAWQRWGFHGLVVLTFANVALGIYWGDSRGAAAAALGLVILFLLLRAGGERSAWSRLE